MTLAQIKKQMLEYTDFYGFDIPDTQKIKEAKSKIECKQILDEYANKLEDMLSDAQSHLDNFKDRLGLSLI